MTKSEGTCRIDAVRVVELTLATRVTLPGAGVEAKFVLMNAKTGDRFGAGTFSTWSEATTAKFNELMQSMEQDICSSVFDGSPTTNSGQSDPPQLEDGVPGL